MSPVSKIILRLFLNFDEKMQVIGHVFEFGKLGYYRFLKMTSSSENRLPLAFASLVDLSLDFF